MSWIKDVGEIIKQTDVVNKVGNAVNAIATKLGVAAEHVYTVFAKQVVAESIGRIIVYFSLAGLLTLLYKFGKKYHSASKWNCGDPENAESIGFIVCCVAFVIIAIIGLIYFLNTVTGVVTGLINPEYRVIHEIANIVKGATN